MKIINPCSTLLTNVEVFSILSDIKSKQAKLESKVKKSSQHHNTIVYETLKYLNSLHNNNQSIKNDIACIKALSKFKLTPLELKQMVNLKPEQPVEIQLILEECEERLTEEQVDEMINIIGKKLFLKKDNKSITTNGFFNLIFYFIC